MRKPTICLFFSDTGGGHRSAVEAINQGLGDLVAGLSPDVIKPSIVVENIVEKSHPINRHFVELYNFLLRHSQQAMKYYYWLIEATKPNDSEIGYQLAKPYVTRALEEINADVIVSVHPMSNHYLSRALKDMGRDKTTRMITVVTDPNGDFWSGWACKDVDLTVVPNELGRNRLIELGVSPDRILVSGMPVHPDFVKPPTCDAAEFRAHLGLDPNRPTVCINAGWAGGGNMTGVYRALADAGKDVQVIFLCGHNRALYERLKKEARLSAIPTAVLPFHDRMADLMSAVDLMVTKAGGLTSFECVARRLPMAIDMITEPMPQELGTAMLLCEQGLASPLSRPGDIVDIVANLRPERLELPEAYSLNRTDAVYTIARTVLALAGVPTTAEALETVSDSQV